MNLILASNSPRRKAMLALGGWQFTVMPADVDESVFDGEDPELYVLRLAQTKALAVSERLMVRLLEQREQQAANGGLAQLDDAADSTLIIAADTTVADGEGEQALILGKPAGAAEAETMLRSLRERTHQVYTALAVLRPADGLLLYDVCRTDVHMRPYSEAEMQAYIASGDPLDKAGAYAIQHAGFHPVERIEGCYNNVVGLPLCRLTDLLTRLGAPPPARPDYPCLYAPQTQCSFVPPELETR